MTPLRTFATICALAGTSPGLAGASDGPPGSRDHPVELEAEPMHRVVLADPEVRVYEATIPGGAGTQFHIHRASGIGIDMTAARLSVRKPDGSFQVFDTRAGDVFPAEAEPAYAHAVENLGAGPYRAVVAEFPLPTASGGGNPVAPFRDCEPVLETARARACRVLLRPGASVVMPAAAPGAVSVSVSGGQLFVAGPDGTAVLRSRAPGDAERIGLPRAVTNAGVTDYVEVVIEPK